MRRQRSIRAKLLGCFGFLVLASIVASLYSITTLHQARNETKAEIVASAMRLDETRQITISLALMRGASLRINLFGVLKNAPEIEKSRPVFEAAAEDMRQAAMRLKASQLTSQERAAVQVIEDGVRVWLQHFPDFLQQNIAGRGDEAASIMVKNVAPIMDAIQKNAAELGRSNLERQQAGAARVEADTARCEMITGGFLLLLLLSGVVGISIALGLVRTLHRIEESVASGAQQLARAAGQVSSSSREMAQGATEQAASLEETSSSTEEINSMARRNTENSKEAATLVAQSDQKFSQANQALDVMVAAMGEISSSSDKISKIIKVIDEIAFQTNILALNAAVEAARAGEAGMGFAVVADEVRNLAQRCGQAARDTASLIEESISKSSGGKLKVDQVAQAIRAVSSDAAKIGTFVGEVHVGSQEQARGIEQIGKAISRMESITQTTAASAEQNAAAAQELSGQSETLQGIVAELSALVEGVSQRA